MNARFFPGIRHLSNAVAQSFRAKILLVTVLGVVMGILFTATVSLIGLHRLANEASEEIGAELNTVSREYLKHHIEDTAARINLGMDHAQADLRILAGITQTLIDHREEFRPLTDVVTQLPFFKDTLQYYPEGRYSQNAPDEPTVVTVQGILHDEQFRIKPYPQQVIDETAILDLIMPPIHTYGAKKTWTYFVGDKDASFLRMAPWTDFGKDAVELYPEQMEVSYWSFFPGLIEAWEAWLADPGGSEKTVSEVTTFPPAIDAASGSVIQMFGHPLWNRERTGFESAVWYDMALDDITRLIESMVVAETGFAFLAFADGNISAIPDEGTRVLGLQESIIGDGHLSRLLRDSREADIAALALPQTDTVVFSQARLSGKDYLLTMRRLAPLNVFYDGTDRTRIEHWTIGFVVPYDEIYAPVITAQTRIQASSQKILTGQVLVLMITIAGLLSLVYVVTGRMTGDLVKLSDGAYHIMQARYDTRVAIHSRDEFGKLGRIFNDMASRLKNNFEQIERQNRELIREARQRQQAEAGLLYERYLLRMLMDTSPDHIYFKDRERRFIRINKALVDWFGVERPEQILGKTDADFFRAEHARQAAEDEQTVMRSGQSLMKREKETWPDGRETWVSTTKSPLMDEGGNIIGTFGISRDITDQVKAEEAIQRYSEQLEVMVAERTQQIHDMQAEMIRKDRLAVLGQFAGSISHELRNPLAVIDSSIYYLNMVLPQRDAKIEQHLQRIKSQVALAVSTIESLLNLTRMRAPIITSAGLAAILADSLASCAIPETVEILQDVESPEMSIEVDREQLRMACKHIIANALDAMHDSGTLTLTTRMLPDQRVEIAFRDTGAGIAPEDLPKIFQPLFTTKMQGLGFGLSIVKMIVENHHGSIHVVSEPGTGTQVTVVLPVRHRSKEQSL